MARLSLCLLQLFVASALLVGTPAAQAEPPVSPLLTGTNPVSPGASLEPRLQGENQSVISFSRRSPAGSIAARSPLGADPLTENDPIVIFKKDPTCKEASKIVTESTLGVLEGEGIPVTVGKDTTTTFYATESNAEGTSECSLGLTYRQVTTPPAAPTFSSVSPASPANDNSPHLTGSADPEAVVSIYTTSDCSGAPVGSGSGATFAAPGIQVSVPDNSVTTFYARATLAGIASTCSTSSISYEEVTVSPPPTSGGEPSGTGSSLPQAPHLRMLPGGRANDNVPQVTGSAPGAVTVRVFAGASCAGAPVVTGAAAAFSTAGLTVHVADNTTNAFTAVSVAGGNASTCSDPVTYVEDSTPPHTRITMGPGVKTRHRKAVFRFADTSEDPPGTNFYCKVNHGNWKACSSPFKLRHLHLKGYVLQVRATDSAGNEETKGAKRRFKVIR